MKFIHTADWQVGMKAAHVGEAGERVRQERIVAAERVVQLARENGAACILVAGDTFEDNAVDRRLIQKVGDILAAFDGPVYLIPGNHDPLVPGCVWEHPVWASHPGLHVLKEARPVEIDGGTLYPCPLREKHSLSDPTQWIDALDSQSIAVGLAHGSVRGLDDELDFPIARDAAARNGLDYLAVGHWHSWGTIDDGRGAARLAYSGTHETTKFGERDSGNVLLVEIDSRGAPPRLTPLRSGGLRWVDIDGDDACLRGEGDLARVRERIEQIDSPDRTLLRIVLSGVVHPGDEEELTRIEEIVASRFLFGRVDAADLSPQPEDESWLRALPPGLLRETAGELQQLAHPRFAGERAEGATSAAATGALLELYRIAQEVRT